MLFRSRENDSDQIAKDGFNVTKKGLSKMDVPPYNCQSPMMMPMMQKLFNVPSSLIVMENFTMYDKDGIAYVPSLDQKPGT